MKNLFKKGAIACAVIAAVAAAPRSASATTLSLDTGYGYIHGYLEIFNPTITFIGDGSLVAQNSAIVETGSSLTLTANWQVVETVPGDGSAYCPGCVIEEYVGWIPPA